MSKRLHESQFIKKECPTVVTEDRTLARLGERIEHVITRLDQLQVSIDRLLDMCLRVEPEDSSAIDE